jgi:hypothetical protein
MKRMILTVAAIFTLAACSGLNEAPTPVNDSAALAVDTVDVVTDSAQLNDAVGGSSSAHQIPVK